MADVFLSLLHRFGVDNLHSFGDSMAPFALQLPTV
jgi:hypothetical protein